MELLLAYEFSIALFGGGAVKYLGQENSIYLRINEAEAWLEAGRRHIELGDCLTETQILLTKLTRGHVHIWSIGTFWAW